MKNILFLAFLPFLGILPTYAQKALDKRLENYDKALNESFVTSYYKHFPDRIKDEFNILIPIVDTLEKKKVIQNYIKSLNLSDDGKELTKKFDALSQILDSIDNHSTALIHCFDDLKSTIENAKTDKLISSKDYKRIVQSKFEEFRKINSTVRKEVRQFFIAFFKGLTDPIMRDILQKVFDAYFDKKVNLKEHNDLKSDKKRLEDDITNLESKQDELLKILDQLCLNQENAELELRKVWDKFFELRGKSSGLINEIMAKTTQLDSQSQKIKFLAAKNYFLQKENRGLQKENTEISLKIKQKEQLFAKMEDSLLFIEEEIEAQGIELKDLKGKKRSLDLEIHRLENKIIKTKSTNFALIFLFICSIIGLVQEIKNKQIFKKLATTLSYKEKQLSDFVEKLRNKELALKRLVRELKAKEKLLNFCLKELNHRVRNNLQNLMILFSVQESTIEDSSSKIILLNAINRLYVMGLLYNHLNFNHNLTAKETNLGEYIKSLILFEIGLFEAPAKKVKVTYSINNSTVQLDNTKPIKANIKVSQEDAIKVGITLNELIVNSFKHGLVDQENPTLFIGLDRVDDGVLIEVRDSGPGYPDSFSFKNLKSYGLKVIEILTQKGRFEHYNDQGACSKLFFKLS